MVIRFIDVLPSRVADVRTDTPAASFGLGARGPYATIARVAHGEDCLSISPNNCHADDGLASGRQGQLVPSEERAILLAEGKFNE
jgi:hypothetical protein